MGQETVSDNGHLKLDPRNARRHSPRNKATIRKSLESVGAGRGILADADGIIRAGNGVYEQWQELGGKVKVVETDGQTLVVTKRTDLTGKAAIRAAALDNIAGDSSAYDYDAAILAEIANDDEIVRALANEDARILALLNANTMPTESDWADAFEAGGDTSNIDGLHTVSFTLKDEDRTLLFAHLKKFDANKNNALVKWLKTVS